MKAIFEIAKGGSHYLSKATKSKLSIGAFIKGNKVVLIDSGLDDSTSQKIHTALQKDQLELTAIINTHSHADHCGGNGYFQAKYPKVQIFATKWEKAFIEMPKLEPVCFCHGAAPFKDLTNNKFLEAQPSNVTHTIDNYEDQTIKIGDESFRIVTLPGHTQGHIGVITPDNILYCGDAFFAGETLDKHGVLFYTDIHDALASLQKIEKLNIDGCVFYHGGYLQNIADITKQHITKILNTSKFILSEIEKNPKNSIDVLTSIVMLQYNVPSNTTAFMLHRTCVNAYLTYLERTNQIKLSTKFCLLQAELCVDLKKTSEHNKVTEEQLRAAQSNVSPTGIGLGSTGGFVGAAAAAAAGAGAGAAGQSAHQVLAFSAGVQQRAQKSIAQSNRFSNLKVISEYEIIQVSDKIVLRLFLKEDKKLKGEMHVDALSLKSLDFMVDVLKYKGIVENVESITKSSNDLHYNGIKLGYKGGDLGKIVVQQPPRYKIEFIQMLKSGFEICFNSKDEELVKKLSSCMDEAQVAHKPVQAADIKVTG